jgi:hypothetical protein
LYASPIRRASVDAFGAGLAKRGQNMQTKVSMVVWAWNLASLRWDAGVGNQLGLAVFVNRDVTAVAGCGSFGDRSIPAADKSGVSTLAA